MPIVQQGYRRRAASTPLARFRAAPIADLALHQILMRRALIALLALSMGPFVVGAFALFLLTRIPDFWAALPSLNVLFGLFLRVQAVFAVLLTVWAGTGLVADDFRTGALLVYFSRPLTRRDYLAGKLGVLVAMDLAVMVIPTLALWGLALAFGAPAMAQPSALRDALEGATRTLPGGIFLPLAILVQSIVVSVALSVLALAAGAVTRSGTTGAAVLVGALVLVDAAAAVAPAGAQLPLQLLSIRRHLLSLEYALFGVSPEPVLFHWAGALACLAVMVAGAGVLLWRRLQAVEVVS